MMPRRSGRALRLAEAVKDRVQRPFGHEARVQLLERAGGGVARIGENLLARRRALGIEFLEPARVMIDFAAHFQHAGRPAREIRSGMERIVFRLDVMLSPVAAVAACRADGEQAVFVAQIDRQAVDLRLDRPGQRFARAAVFARA